MARLFFASFILFPFYAFAQEPEKPEPIEADRPDQTETPAIVPKGMFQAETGFVYEKANSDEESFVTPTVLWKYGVNENFELRLITELETQKNPQTTTTGLAPVKVGFKAKLLEENGIIPKTSIIAHLQLPDLASKEFKAEHYAALFRFTMQHTLSDDFSLGYNLGAEWDGNVPDATFIYTLTAGYSISEKLGCYAEVFGFAPEESTTYHSADGGFTYLISNDFMIDASAGVGLTELAPDYYISLGCSFRL
ncbi:transporter [Flavobacterium silvaticum]|uniref:Transporter n=1 Tax=Flavobacterium silvaticum TaxID=1852020 RepID=A0A972FTP8_9FLAO|nr:transporter [Flavobacterium silvaticum]NMH28298.1 transporter [Flavobacterium silvaticum]